MTGEPRNWTTDEILAEMGGGFVVARDDSAGKQPLPDSLGLTGPGERDIGWESHIQTVHENDRANLARVWWDAIDAPGELQEGSLRQRVGDVWRSRLTKVLDLQHQPEIGAVLVATIDLGIVAAPEPATKERERLGIEDVAHFQRPTWILQELDSVGRVLNTEGDVEAVFGRCADELVDGSVLKFIHESDHVAGLEMWSALLGDPGGSRTIRQRIVRPDGTNRWIESTVLNRLAPDGSGTVLAISHDITERRHHERDLARRAATDSLTGLPNRAALHAALEAMMVAGSATVAFLDLDGFKVVNDRLGHAIGDEVLTAIGRRLRNAVADATNVEGALVGRWGGDEFVLIGPQNCEAELRAVISRAFADQIIVAGLSWRPSCSYGIAHGHGDDDADRVMRSADTAMYEAKAQRAP